MVLRRYADLYALIRKIPKGRVATYGQIARLAGIPKQPRQVGYALSAMASDRLAPWHRVINSQGKISPRSEPSFENIQRSLLEEEGIRFDAQGRVALRQFQWKK